MIARRWIVLGSIVAVIAGVAAYRYLGWSPVDPVSTVRAAGPVRVPLDLSRPEAVIRTSSLARLPRDLLRLPIARDVLTEDLAFYYEQHEDRLALGGALRRIAYEHQLDWSDTLLKAALDESAEIGLWRDGKGALRRFALVLDRNTLATVLQELAAVALKDRQLQIAGEISLEGYSTPVYSLALSPRRSLLIISGGERIVVLSDPWMLLDQDGKVMVSAQRAIANWLANPGVLASAFQLDNSTQAPAHSLAIGAPALALGYAAFVPSFKALRFDYSVAAGWSTQVWMDPATPETKPREDAQTWKVLPVNPSACVQLPLDWNLVLSVMGVAKIASGNTNELALREGSAVACWYRESNLYSPVFVLRLQTTPKDRDAIVRTLAEWALRLPLTEKTKGSDDEKAVATPEAVPGSDTLVKPEIRAGVLRWQPPGLARPGLPVPTVAAKGDYLFFSPDPALVDRALDTLARRNPSVSDQMSEARDTLAFITPRALAPMIEREALAALWRPADANMRAAVQTHLAPRMQALARYPAYRLTFGARPPAQGWRSVEWHAIGGAK
ncbi:MAG: DUF2138 family protein [Burkholderiales bacterium]